VHKNTQAGLADNYGKEIDTGPSDAAAAKAALRQQLGGRRASRPDAVRARDDDRRQQRLLALLTDRYPHHTGVTVAVYLSRPPEPATVALAQILHDTGWHVIVPSPGAARWTDPAWSWYGEPLLPAELGAADVIIMPGLAGTRDGARLGRGGGWYDRALPDAQDGAPRWLLLNDDEVVDELPTEPHDARVDLIVTPSDIIECGSSLIGAR